MSTCGNCGHARPISGNEAHRYCWRFPPRVTVVLQPAPRQAPAVARAGQGGPAIDLVPRDYTAAPVVGATERCGEWVEALP